MNTHAEALINTITNVHVYFLALRSLARHNGPLIWLYGAIINRPIPLWRNKKEQECREGGSGGSVMDTGPVIRRRVPC